MPCGSCGGSRSHSTVHPERKVGPAPSAEAMAASAQTRYVVVRSQTATEGKRFSTLNAAQDFARRSGGIVRML